MKKIATLFVIALFVVKVHAQVNLQTGGATFSLPMFNWQDNKSRLNSVVALNYNSGNGLRVNDVATNVGQGWNLIAGGVITRMQVGEPDDQKPREGDYNDITKYPAGYLYDTSAAGASKGCPKSLTHYPIFGWENQLYKQHNLVATDRELDYFSFQFNGQTGLFVLGKGNGDVGVSLGDNHLKISFDRDESMITNQINSGIRTTITAFYIQDENGLKYKFSKHGLTKVLKMGYCESDLKEIQNQPRKWGGVYHEASIDKNDLVNPYIINSWYLTEVEDILTHRKITFNYPDATLRNINAAAGTRIANQNGYSVITHHFSVTQTPEISSVNYPDGHTVNFTYGKARADLNGDYVLAAVDVTYNNRYLSRYQLNTGYFILNRYGTPISDYQKSVARLCLLSVKQIGVDLKADNPPYIFDYYTGSSATDDFVPPPFFHMKDIWGFYNGHNSTARDGAPLALTKSLAEMDNNDLNGLCFQSNATTDVVLNPKTGFAKNGLLKQIIYPTGGAIGYEYRQDTGLLNGQYREVGGVHVSETKVTDGGHSNGCDNPITTQYNYVDASGNSSMWGLEMPVNTTTVYNHYEPEGKYVSWHLFSAECGFDYQYPGLMSREDRVDLTSEQQFMQTFSDVLNVVSAVLEVIDVIKYVALESGPGAVIIDAILYVVELGFSCLSNTSSNTGAVSYYNSDINAMNPLPLQFKRVEVVNGSGGIGKTVQEFTSSDDYAIWEPTNPTQSMKQRFAPWAYGLPKKATVYDVNGNKVKETENVYDTSNAKSDFNVISKNINGNVNTGLVSCKNLIKRSSSQNNTDWLNSATYDASTFTTTDYVGPEGVVIAVEIYQVYSGRMELKDSYERVYKTTDQSRVLETQTHYDYNPANYQVSGITTTQSNGDINYKNIRYSCDYNSGILSALTQNNMLSVPVATTTSVQKASGNSGVQYLGEHVTEFATLANGDIKPYRTLEQRFSQPTASMTFYQGPNNSYNPPYKETQTFSYDAGGNLIAMKDEGNHIVSNVYGYDDKYVIASVINADAGIDKSAYTSFEDPTSFGGWTVSNNSGVDATTAITGAGSYALSGNSLTASGLNTAKGYKLSLWATGTVNISGGTASLVTSNSSIGINGFTYYEYTIAAGASSISISGNGNIDELRLYPVMARMRTVTYDPLIGKTSECDENNRITYYEYDELGRLRFIKDEKKSVVKMYEYNTVSNKQGGCPGTYYNHLITETFTKNNCTGNYTGGNITYTVPANRYSSTISQYDADIQAAAEIDANAQTYANTNGACISIYYNTGVSQNFTKHGCLPGTTGTTVTYSVPANKYSSTVSQADADAKAQREIAANGQAYANNNPAAACVTDNTPQWRTVGTPQYQCGSGSLAGHQLVLITDVNPNSSTYNQTQWVDNGVDAVNCPVTPCIGCNGPAYKCINNFCEFGWKVYTRSFPLDNGQWQCIYHYEWSDGSWSYNYVEIQNGIGCIQMIE